MAGPRPLRIREKTPAPFSGGRLLRRAAVGCLPFLLGALACGGAARCFGQTDRDAAGRRALRRTPVVEVYENWKDSVVCITGTMVKGKEPLIEEFFRVPENEQVVGSLGSGFVVHEAGYILTNAHAVAKVIAPRVTFDVRARQYWAEVISLDRRHDLAVLKIGAGRPLKPVRLAQSGDLMIGETVIVVGNPHGLIRTCTVGVLSATDRVIQPDGLPGVTLRGLIQSDAALSPGSSGGPWLNVLGEVIGISSGGKPDSQRIGFAVPAATIRKTLPDMLDVHRRYGLSTGLHVQADQPCKVLAVSPGSPAAKTGVLPDDVLMQLDGRAIASGADFHLALVGRQPGAKAKLRLLRGGKPFSGWLTLGRRPKPDGATLLSRKLGLTAVPLDSAKARAMGLRGNRGVVITAVAGGLYDRLKNPPLPGDVLAQIDGIRPRQLDHLGLLLDRLEPRQPVQLVFLRLRGDLATRVDLTVTPRK